MAIDPYGTKKKKTRNGIRKSKVGDDRRVTSEKLRKLYKKRIEREAGAVPRSIKGLEKAPEVYKIQAQQLSKEGKASKSKGTLRKGKSQFRKDVTKTTRLLNPITAGKKIAKHSKKIASKVAPKIVKSAKKKLTKVKSYFGYRHGGGILEQHD